MTPAFPSALGYRSSYAGYKLGPEASRSQPSVSASELSSLHKVSSVLSDMHLSDAKSDVSLREALDVSLQLNTRAQ